jgi:hypothetical protein
MNDLWKIPPYVAGRNDDMPQIQFVSNPEKNFTEEIGTAIKHAAALNCPDIEPPANNYA